MQFAYGEDGVDVLATPFLTQFPFLARNAARFAQRLDLGLNLHPEPLIYT